MTISPHQIADRLGEIRTLIKGLRAEEARLRQALLETRLNGPVSGDYFRVYIQERQTKRFDHKRLPDHILNDSHFWKAATSRAVITRPLSNDSYYPTNAQNRKKTPESKPISSSEVQLIEPW